MVMRCELEVILWKSPRAWIRGVSRTMPHSVQERRGEENQIILGGPLTIPKITYDANFYWVSYLSPPFIVKLGQLLPIF